MNLALWIAAGVLALVALVGGLGKLFVPMAKLAETPGATWTTRVGPGFVRTLGVLEVLAVGGLLLPGLGLVPVTAVCWVLLMIGAMITHARLGEPGFVVLNVVYLALAAFIAWGRLGPEQFAA